MPDITFQEAFVNGLRRDSRNNRNSQFLVQCSGLIPTEWGLKQLPGFTYPISAATLETITDGDMSADTNWTLQAGWAIAGGVLTGTNVTDTAQQLYADQVAGNQIVSGIPYTVTFTIASWTAGSVTPKLGTTAGTARSAAGTYTEVIISNGADFTLLGAAFSGTIDNVSVTPAWPNPLLLTADKALLLAGPNNVYSVNGTTWVATAIPFYDAASISQVNVPAYGGIWQLAAFQDMWFLTNGVDLLYKIPSTAGAVKALLGTRGESVVNGAFAGDTDWTKGAGWAITTVATATLASSDLAQPRADQVEGQELETGVEYILTYTYTRSAGTLTPKLGSTAGTTVSAAGPVTVTENIIAGGATPSIIFTGAGFSGTIDNVSVVRATTLAVNAIANHDNRLVLGGCSGNYFTHTNFTSKIFAAWRETSADEIVITDTDTFDTGWLIYSAQAGGDNDIPFATLLAMFNTPTNTIFTKFEEIIIGAIERGEMGLLPLKRANDVYVLKPLGNDLMVYGKNSISRLTWTELPYKGSTKQGYREELLFEFGIASRGAVAGTEKEHVFVTKQGEVYRINGESITREGYDEFVGALTLANIVMAHDPIENFYWMSDGTNGYCLTRTGLGKCSDIMPLSILRIDATDGRVGTGVVASPVTGATVETETFDAPNRQIFEVGFLDIATIDTTPTGWQGATKYRMNKADGFTTKSAAAFDDRGRLRDKSPALDARILLTATDRTLVDLERLVVEEGKGKLSLRDLLNA